MPQRMASLFICQLGLAVAANPIEPHRSRASGAIYLFLRLEQLHLDDHDQAFHRACRIFCDAAALRIVASAPKPAPSIATLKVASPPIQAARG
jgi:hypothetical protein